MKGLARSSKEEHQTRRLLSFYLFLRRFHAASLQPHASCCCLLYCCLLPVTCSVASACCLLLLAVLLPVDFDPLPSLLPPTCCLVPPGFLPAVCCFLSVASFVWKYLTHRRHHKLHSVLEEAGVVPREGAKAGPDRTEAGTKGPTPQRRRMSET